MSFRVTQPLLALGLVLGCALGQAAAQERDTAKPQTSLWNVLNLPTFDRLTKSVRPKPKLPTIAEKKTSSSDVLSIDLPAAKPPPKPEPESAVASPFSSTSSNRRSAIQKRELTQNKPAPAAAEFNPSQAPSPPPVTPHWTPRFVEQAGYLQLPDEELARPVAVNMQGDLISQRVTVARAVARMDPTLSVAPTVVRAMASADSNAPTPAAQLATASPAAAH